MKEYRITADRENGASFDARITEQSEAAARKTFIDRYRYDFTAITSIELVNENATATKEQERKALEKIKKIVEGLGPQSYIATAFEGCFDDAEQNIDFDASFSMKSRWESEKENSIHFQQAASMLSAENDKANAEAERLRKEGLRMMHRIPSTDSVTDCITLAKQTAAEYKNRMNEAAAEIVRCADAPGSEAFSQAYKDHRNAKASMEYYDSLAANLEATITSVE